MRPIPDFFEPPPSHVVNDYYNLVVALNNTIPEKTSNNLLIATWNLKKFSSLTKKWLSDSNDSPKRDFTAIQTITEIVSRFDVVAIQEVMGNLRALRYLINMLGKDWAFLMTDITLGVAGGAERMAFVFNRTRVKLSGLACELVIPPDWSENITNQYPQQFARTPYAVSFKRESATFILVTLHIDYGDQSIDRIPELKDIAKWMYDWAERVTSWHHNLITLGDFNIDREGDELWGAFTSTGLKVPKCLENQKRSIFATAEDTKKEKYYDQIAWFQDSAKNNLIEMKINDGDNFDFLPYVYQHLSLKKNSIQHRISDHYPLWCEFII
ncbi:MAG: endonuclease/exonuclease/phosphatase family protein [Thermoplasmatales archaeon]|nr:MAG: endonuclease/exonuclease/phosphatase family protein [Thermoplasmatales archaeon]